MGFRALGFGVFGLGFRGSGYLGGLQSPHNTKSDGIMTWKLREAGCTETAIGVPWSFTRNKGESHVKSRDDDMEVGDCLDYIKDVYHLKDEES